MAVWAIKLHDKVVKQFAIEDGERLVIGRSSEADVVVDNTAISRKHTALERRNGVYFLEDLGSLNGTMVNGKKIDSCVQLFDDDVVEVGKFLLLPAEALKDAKFVSQSAPMDYGDETVFVNRGPRSDAAPKAKEKGKALHHLTVLKGNGSPAEVPLLGRSSVKIGKDINCDLRVSSWFVAQAQCYVINRDKKFYLVPQRSWVKTTVNGIAVREERELLKGDIIQIRGVQIRFE
ncbi:MAG: FHA domain-containing protein [Proteobacteria bacterium]|nr:FHA domain-containing protein [Pseudomonadota bacterium]MBU4295713.1 FHA domain-containing protein [Pseudomonadota bacterium]MCG2747226.1 FHA domain-containing protein [Desulfobulbaceae bacterium]